MNSKQMLTTHLIETTTRHLPTIDLVAWLDKAQAF